MDPRRYIQLLVLLSLGPIASGCASSGGQTGEETDGPCVDVRSALQLDEVSPLGFSASEVLASLGTSIQVPLAWLSIDGVEYGPETGTSTMVLDFEQEATAFWVDSEPRSTTVELVQFCPDRVELERSVRLSTSGGALNERFVATLSAAQRDDTWLIHLFEPAELSGQLTLTSRLGRWTRLTLQAHLRGGDVSGQLAAGIEGSSGSGTDGSVSFVNLSLACFGVPSDGSAFDCGE